MSRKKITIDKFFSDRLKTLLKDHLDITQAELSSKVGISQGYLSMVLKGMRGASAELIAGLHIHYGEYLDWLLTGEGEMIRKPESENKIQVNKDTPIYKVKNLNSDPETAGLLSMTREILNSGTDSLAFLATTIRFLHNALKTAKRLDKLEKQIFKKDDKF